MARDRCDWCCDPSAVVNNEWSRDTAFLAVLCQILEALGGSTGGVTKIIAGTNVTITSTLPDGKGDVTIDAINQRSAHLIWETDTTFTNVTGDMTMPGTPQSSINVSYLAFFDGTVDEIALCAQTLSAGGQITVKLLVNGVVVYTNAAPINANRHVFTGVGAVVAQGDGIACQLTVTGTAQNGIYVGALLNE